MLQLKQLRINAGHLHKMLTKSLLARAHPQEKQKCDLLGKYTFSTTSRIIIRMLLEDMSF